MPDHQNQDNDQDPTEIHSTDYDEILLPLVPCGMTLENIIDLTGELEHLNELVMLQLKKEGGFSCPESYFSVVQPLLDLLETEIRIRYHEKMNCQELTLLVQDWIDKEIAGLKK